MTATDNTGNTSTANESITISKTDTSGPNISTFTSNTNNFTLTTSLKTRLITFTVVVNDNVAVKSITVSGATPLTTGGGGGGVPPHQLMVLGKLVIDENKLLMMKFN